MTAVKVENKLLKTHGDKDSTKKVEDKVAGLDQSKTGKSKFKNISERFYPTMDKSKA